MKALVWIVVLSGLGTTAAVAYPTPDPSTLVVDKADPATINSDWLASTSYLIGQLHAISETPLVPAVPKPAAEPGNTPPLAEARSTAFGFQVDLNMDGKYDEFLSLPLPPMLGTAYNPERNDASKISTKIFSLAIPDAGPASESSLWLQALGESQKVQIVDAGAVVRRQAQAKFGALESKSQEKWVHVPRLPAGWLAVLLGVGVFFWQRRLVQRQVSST